MLLVSEAWRTTKATLVVLVEILIDRVIISQKRTKQTLIWHSFDNCRRPKVIWWCVYLGSQDWKLGSSSRLLTTKVGTVSLRQWPKPTRCAQSENSSLLLGLWWNCVFQPRWYHSLCRRNEKLIKASRPYLSSEKKTNSNSNEHFIKEWYILKGEYRLLQRNRANIAK